MRRGAQAGFWACVALQVLVVVVMIARKQSVLYFGRTIVLESEPVDPHSLFSGDYARLAFRVHTVLAPSWNPWPPKEGDPIYSELAPSGTSWALAAVHQSMPDAVAQDHVVLRGRVVSSQRWEGQPVFDLVDISSPGWLAEQAPDAPWRRSRMPLGTKEGIWHVGFGEALPEGTSVYVRLTSIRGHPWQLSGVESTPQAAHVDERYQEVILGGRVGPRESLPKINAEYGIETFYIPEGSGRPYERAGLEVEIVVNARGEAVVKGVRL